MLRDGIAKGAVPVQHRQAGPDTHCPQVHVNLGCLKELHALHNPSLVQHHTINLNINVAQILSTVEALELLGGLPEQVQQRQVVTPNFQNTPHPQTLATATRFRGKKFNISHNVQYL